MKRTLHRDHCRGGAWTTSGASAPAEETTLSGLGWAQRLAWAPLSISESAQQSFRARCVDVNGDRPPSKSQPFVDAQLAVGWLGSSWALEALACGLNALVQGPRLYTKLCFITFFVHLQQSVKICENQVVKWFRWLCASILVSET